LIKNLKLKIMKKVLLFLSLALFLSAGVVTATKIQSVNATSAELIVDAEDLSSIAPFANADDDDKKKEAAKEKCSKENCNKENCKEKCDKKAEAKCDKGEKKCCNKDKGKK
jgi:hypothetical protein